MVYKMQTYSRMDVLHAMAYFIVQWIIIGAVAKSKCAVEKR